MWISGHETDASGRSIARKDTQHTGDSSPREGSLFEHPPAASLAPNLQSRYSTRELISKYEAISSPQGAPPFRIPPNQSSLGPLVATNLPRRDYPLPELPSPTKPTQAPFSFRNLLTVFGKKNRNLRHPQPETFVSDTKPAVPKAADAFNTSASSARAGPALYLSSSANPPTWHRCSLTISRSHLIVTFSEDTRRITHTIPLLYCMDVVSLASHQLGHDIPIPRDRQTDKIAHVFELNLERCELGKERFAVWGAAERGRWVSATWDAILACRDPNRAKEDVCISTPDGIIRGSRFATREHADIQDLFSLTSSVSAPTTLTRAPRLGVPFVSVSRYSGLPSSSSIQSPGSMSIVRQRLDKLEAQERSPHPHALTRGVSGSGTYITSSMRRRVQCGHDISAHETQTNCLERVGTTTAGFSNDEESQETSFTALDAHAMYHEQELPVGSLAKEMSYSGSEDKIEKDVSPRTVRLDGPERSSTRPAESVESLESKLQSLLTYFQEHAARQSSQASGIAQKLALLHDGVDTIVANMKARPLSISEVDMVSVHAKLDQIKNDIAGFDFEAICTFFEGMAPASLTWGAPGSNNLVKAPVPGGQLKDLSPVSAKFDELRNDLRGDLPLILQKLSELDTPAAVQADMESIMTKLKNILNIMNIYAETQSSPADLIGLHTKLDSLIALNTSPLDKSKQDLIPDESAIYKKSHSEHSEKVVGDDAEGLLNRGETDGRNTLSVLTNLEQVTKLLELLQDDKASRETQSQQQSDTVRYLNELNMWLENFVTGSAGNMRQVITGVDRLCKEWLPIEGRAAVESSNGKLDENKEPPGPHNAFILLRRFLDEQEKRSEDTHGLQAAIQNLTETVKENMAKNAEGRIEMARHAQAQESLINTLVVELTQEIRGERLRFVDAMKDATSVNVAIHVEEFKKVLGGLHHEKMVLEQQIVDLLSFVAKQRQGHPMQTQPQGATLEVSRAPTRPLPQINDRKFPPRHVGDIPP